MGPEERAWLSEHKPKNAADVVQEYWDDCSLWPDLHLGLVKLPLRTHGMWTLLLRLHMQLLQQQKKHERPAKRRSCSPSCKQHKKAAGGQPVRRSARLSDQHWFFFVLAFVHALRLALAHS